MLCCVFPNLSAAHNPTGVGRCGAEISALPSGIRTLMCSGMMQSRAPSFLLCGVGQGGFRFKRWRITAQLEPPGEGEQAEGDKEVQEMLVEIVRLETGKVRVNEFVEERSKHLTDIAEQANEEYDRIAEEAMKNIDEAGSKVLEQMEVQAQAFEEELAAARAEIEADERDLAVFEKNVEEARSEGLFFKSLYRSAKLWKDRSAQEQEEIKERATAVNDVVQKSAGSKARRALYGVLIFVLTLSVLEAGMSAIVPWPKLIIYVLILVGLVIQLTYENMIAADSKKDDKK